MYREVEQRRRHQETVRVIANAARTQPDLAETLQAILDETNAYLEADAISFQTLNGVAQELAVQATIKASQRGWRKHVHISQAKSKTIEEEPEKVEQYYYINALDNSLSESIIPIRDKYGTPFGIFLLEHSTL